MTVVTISALMIKDRNSGNNGCRYFLSINFPLLKLFTVSFLTINAVIFLVSTEAWWIGSTLKGKTYTSASLNKVNLLCILMTICEFLTVQNQGI